ncbi:MAG TPA: hypothetical protein PKD70_03915 [Saprospiraceae bacterium]|nr:hypothetical protein [Saprospiraceae bacterium]HMP13002.1 hypothetical protein [Saprospiraceae bacterium]
MKIASTFSAVALLLALGACSPRLSPFTERIYDENRLTEVDLKKIQFYLSDDIVLRRTLSVTDTRVQGGSIRIEGGRQMEEIVIRGGTPGVFLFSPKAKRFAISFESNREERYLMFGPNPKMQGRFTLLASEWGPQRGTVTYGGQQFEVTTSAAWAGLLVDIKRMDRVDMKSRTASGRTIR